MHDAQELHCVCLQSTGAGVGAGVGLDVGRTRQAVLPKAPFVYFDLAQGVHIEAPTVPVYVSAGHSEHCVEPTAPAKRPAAQVEQLWLFTAVL